MLGKIVLTNNDIQIPASSNKIGRKKHEVKESETKKYDI